jgi:predicted outer membrane repeat protein
MNTISENHAELEGGGLAFWSTDGPILFDNVIEANHTGIRGGGLFANASSPLVVRNVFLENLCDRNGAGMSCVSESDARIEGNRFSGNVAGLGGGGLHCDLSSPEVVSNLFVGNVAECDGEACGGGGIFCTTESDLVITANTFYGNSATKQGGAIHVLVFSNVSITNTILWENHGEGDAELSVLLADVDVSRSIVRGGWPGEGNLDSDPLWVDPLSGDFHLRTGSPAVDAGSNHAPALPDTDYEGDSRIVAGMPGGDAVADVGADELAPEVAARFGTVNATGESLANVLTVNGSSGDARRVVTISLLTPISVEMTPSPAGPTTAPFVLYAWEGAPDLVTIVPQPYGLGWTGFATPLQPELPQPVQIWNNLGHAPLLGAATQPSVPAPSTVIQKLARFRATFTLQGFILDDGSAAEGPGSVTNAVVVSVVD